MCIPDGTLRAKLDGELAQNEVRDVEEHVAAGASCRARMTQISEQAAQVQALISELAPHAPGAAPDPVAALARFRARRRAPAPLLARLFPRRLAPAWGVLAIATLLVFLVFSAPARVFAQKLLGLLRIRQIAAVSIDRNLFAEGDGKLLGRLLSDNVTVGRDEKSMAAASREEAERLAGFEVRLPEARTGEPAYRVEGAHAFQLTVNRERVEAFLTLVGRPDLELPASFDGAKVAVDIPRGIVATSGECPKPGVPVNPAAANWESCLALAQVPVPTVVTIPDLNLAVIAEVGLQLAGMTAEQAREFSRTVDWTSTLVVPVPREVASYENVNVDGVSGVLIQHRPYRNAPPGYALVWVNRGFIYTLTGFGNPGAAVPLANSMR